ncbi:Transglutaminase-like superfamily protein [Fervidobacterium changbaicum]|uniref:Transglutaminase-like domain-containing protein n=1 Tax=Fervidobacterium changbaicum TaxID=310769 RepID=A0ABX5QTF6_9BACT|nr:transglutaminase domain-containing protein [Fervidobacterium changbaicum]QAV33811.1 hypothetical protein CBS1_08880 [Fervidobacterium changbaicum]SDH67730.1 Transglutaminase-like superfamily protein [Fervidobacterium changbaicum]
MKRTSILTLIVLSLLCTMAFAKVYQVYSADDVERAIVSDIHSYEQKTVLKANGTNNATMLKLVGTIIEIIPEQLFIQRWSADSIEQAGSVETTITYVYLESEAERKAVDEFISKNLPSILKNARTDLEKVYALNEWIKSYIQYDESYSHKNAYSTLKDRKGVCQGYALLFYRLAKAAGIDVLLVSGEAKSPYESAEKLVPHAWNIVKIEGNWYYIDTTWNDSLGMNTYFLFGKNQARYSHYAKTKIPVTVSTKGFAEKLYEEILSGSKQSAGLFNSLYGNLADKYDDLVAYLTKGLRDRSDVVFVGHTNFVSKYLSKAVEEALYNANVKSVSYDYSHFYLFTYGDKDFYVWQVRFK